MIDNELLRQVAQLGSLPEVDFCAFLRMMKPITFDKKQIILKQGGICSKIWFLQSGAIRMFRVENQKDITLNLFTHQRLFTDLVALRDKLPALLQIEAITQTTAFEIEAEDLFSLLEASLPAERIGRKIFEQLLYEETARLHDVLYRSPTERYINLIKNNPDIILQIPLRYIASYLSVKPETLSRIRKQQSIVE